MAYNFRIISTIILSLLLLLQAQFFQNGPSQQTASFDPLVTVEQAWKSYPARIKSLVEAISTEHQDLNNFAKHLQVGDTIAACQDLLLHLKSIDRTWVISAIDELPTADVEAMAFTLIADSVLINGVKDRIPLKTNGTWQWDHLGPHQDAEFAYSLNSHKYLPALFLQWQKTKNNLLVERFDRIVQDWVVQHPLPAPNDSIFLVLQDGATLDYRDIGEVQWRTLDTGRRLGAVWPQLFFGFLHNQSFSEATKLLMLASITEQASYLRQYHKSGHNWTTMEMNGLALVGLAFPEFRQAQDWSSYALDVMSQEINRQVYPDGVQTEISTKTQWVALRRFESVAANFQKAGQQIDMGFLDRIEEMYQYLAYCMRPDGHQPLNNDSDREDLRLRVLSAAEKFERSDWQYIATNGAEGELPAKGPSLTFDWSGISIHRSGWDRNADWSFFDIGPYGTGHQHRDMLHFSLSAFGRDFLVDGGRYTHRNYFSFDPTNWRGYFRSSLSHNVLLIDDQGQLAGPLRSSKALIPGEDFEHQADFDFATATFVSGFESVVDQIEHTRSVLYVRESTWLVIDQLRMDQPHKVTALWHLAPDLDIKQKAGQIVATTTDGTVLGIRALGNIDWDVEVIQGQEEPVIQGWYSPDYDVRIPNPTLEYSANVSAKSIYFAWLFYGRKDGSTPQEASLHHVGQTIEINYLDLKNRERSISFPLDRDVARIKIQ